MAGPFFHIWNCLVQITWSLGRWIRTVIAGVIPVSVMSESCKCHVIWKGRFLALPCCLFWVSVYLEVSGFTLVSVCLKTSTPISHVLERRKKKPKQKKPPTIKTVAVIHLLCNDLPGLHHPGSQLFGSPLKKFCLHLKLSVKKPT